MAGRKYPIYERAPERPHKCIVSGLAGPVVDLGKFIEDYGRVYLHVNIVAAIATTHGFITDAEAETLKTEMAAAREEADRNPAIMEDLLDGITALVATARAAARGGGADDGGGDPALPDAPDVGDRVDPDGDAAGAGDRSAVGEDAGRVPEDAHPVFDQPAVPSE